jgi:hypothetical protein
VRAPGSRYRAPCGEVDGGEVKRIAYISGPMTGLPELNFPAFNAAAVSLRARGWEVVNPAELDAQDTEPRTWEEYMRRDIVELMRCTHIALLPGWQRSRGASIEARLAADLGITRIDL